MRALRVLRFSAFSALSVVSLLLSGRRRRRRQLHRLAHRAVARRIPRGEADPLPAGRIALRFADVTAQIRPETVHLASLTAPSALRILEQNYQYDLLNPAKLLDKFVGRDLTLVLRRYQNNTESFEPVQATLLSNNGGQVWRINSQIVINPTNIAEMRFPDLPKNLVATPTLVWDLDNSETGPQNIEASYLTNGMNWRADYVLLVNADDTKGDLQGWVTLTNASGASFEDARLQLVAGDVNRVTPERNAAVAGFMAKSMAVDEAQFQEQGFFEYHMYTLQRPTTIRDNETKQVSLLEAAGFEVKKEFVLNGQRYYYTGYNNPGQAIKEKVGVFVQFRNSQQNKLGMPLPAGTIRLYKKDDKGNQQFIGEDRIDHTPKDEDVRVKVGDAFDIVAERKQTDYKVIASGHVYEYAYEIKIRNHKDSPVTVVVNAGIGMFLFVTVKVGLSWNASSPAYSRRINVGVSTSNLTCPSTTTFEAAAAG